ncbi:MAG: thioredoxin domain-containing protein, partial [Methanoregulaceae archaeon]|nr:thioredoxin domain-containing protein [Methanoregulaceae archaeon]
EIGRRWRESRPELLKAAGSVLELLSNTKEKGGRLRRSMPDSGFQELLLRFDRINGGFGDAPKFPLPHNLLFLLRYSRLKGEEKAVRMVEKTLRGMAMGGIYDQLGSGFHRYSTDSHWLVPHFEKMLYDQALLIMVYTEAYQATGDDLFGTIARECMDYVLREMTSPEGGFFSAQDADTEGEEGGYYLWTKKEVEDLLDKEMAAFVSGAWHLTTAGNYIDPGTGERTGKNILNLPRDPRDLHSRTGMQAEDSSVILSEARRILLSARKERHTPLTDDKILADWNGLMIAAFARSARVFGDTRYRDAAARAAGFILASMRDADGLLLHRYRNGTAGISGQATDYAYLIFGLTELYMATFSPVYLSAAVDLQGRFEKHFRDPSDGGFFTAPVTQTDLIARQKDFYDGALPSSNSVAFTNLLRLTMLTGDTSFERCASDLARLYAGFLEQSPAGHTFFLSGLCLLFGPSAEIVICEGPEGEPAEDLAGALNTLYLPFMVVLLKNSGTEEELGAIAPFTREMSPVGGKTAAYICSRHTCSVPVTGVKELLESAEKRSGRG